MIKKKSLKENRLLKEDLDEKIDKIFNYNDSIEVVSKETCLKQLDNAIILSMTDKENE